MEEPTVDTTTAADVEELLPTRFEVELEFVQSLANIPYVTYLLTQNTSKNQQGTQIYKDPKFKNYLKYLEYWCEPPYSQCIVYPNALFVLKLINGFMDKAVVNEDGILEGVDELPRVLQLQGAQWMNEMVERWET
ncbi:hypothetical protein Kpol_461p3 [Vanderwaltozyma polyspora DSM 70294]|uniref:Mediator of RNA polymerase II transcription subunit 31 n=1 Tax=Vanderwaltozyma polyspora (strain ATCC 22028 / DSM 70294 / BCRC 21397 / CBS 2163 / NBRC 10782 / NRRL Y-8283 / UCD 57-17) TaxID=436907 RepID=A7TR40_VANPO|nr:uncharacterized protein Kpol_461p3 [Vanderwaltozyma polyspora DSM 70294]EDO15250.1 hypothetical protein Kpol_461p3 [Vanderwaltozyma polyspora DSM 70294]